MVEIDEGVGRPDLFPEFVASNQVSGSPQQSGKHVQRLSLQAQLPATLAELARADVQLKSVEAQ
jgi:hypothetical protein